ncbi:SIS domain-containing protein [Nocardioides sp. C4-1]|uniref:SIS domain-containing protein n=1 Tax=Nocardioides sp. C4-1 TaxID=3151851 RepID=UPI00326385CB
MTAQTLAPGTQMAREMAEQPDAVRRTLAALRPQRADVAHLFEGRSRVLLVARGSSDNAAVYGSYLLETRVGIVAGLASASVATHYAASLDLSDTLVVSVSQSGSTAEIVETQAWARACGAATVAITNVAGSPLACDADVALVTQAGPELAVPATKTYVGQLVAMAVLATALAPDPAILDADLDRVADEIERLLAARAGVGDAVEALQAASYAVVAGRGLMLGTALETALKLEETCLRPVRGYSYADLRHGPISVVTSGTAAVLVAAPDGPLAGAMVDLALDLRERGAVVVGIGGSAAFPTACDVHVAGPDLPEAVAPLATVVAAQLVVEELAQALGLDPDAPRGLSKVTSTDRDS